MRPQVPGVQRDRGYSAGSQIREQSLWQSTMLPLLAGVCLILGAALAWGVREHGRAARLGEQCDRLSLRNWEVENAYVVVLARRDDVAGFLTDPRTHLYRLAGPGGRSLTIAWQEGTRTGFVLGDRMSLPPDGQKYAVWVTGEGRRELAGRFVPEAGMTCVSFRAPGGTGAARSFAVGLEEEPGSPEAGEAILYKSP